MMKTEPFIFVFFLCALVLISVVAVEPFKDEKQTNAFDMSKTKVAVNKHAGSGGGHDGHQGKGHEDGEWGFWINDGGGWGAWLEHAGWKGWIKNEGVSGGGGGGGGGRGGGGEGGGRGRGGGGGGGQRGREKEVSWGEEENIGLGGEGGRETEENWRRGENNRIRGEYLENKGPVWTRGTNKGSGGINGGGRGQGVFGIVEIRKREISDREVEEILITSLVREEEKWKREIKKDYKEMDVDVGSNQQVVDSEKRKSKDESTNTVPLYKLLSFADPLDHLLMFVGTIGAIRN
ncbi:hypothetical protein RYX36_006106 [Vicia faba]